MPDKPNAVTREREPLLPFGFFGIFWYGYGAGLLVDGGKHFVTGLVFIALATLASAIYGWRAFGLHVTRRVPRTVGRHV